jgi:RNA-dependent RNA polymerase
MDRLITDDLDEYERKVLEKKMETLVDLYYLALDAPKTGMKVNSSFDYTQFVVSNAYM